MTFMIGVLGSVVFWVVYFVMGFFCGSLLIKYIAPKTYRFIMTGRGSRDCGIDDHVFIALFNMLFWPLIIIAVVMWFAMKLFVTKIAWPLFRKGVKASVGLVPDIEIKKKEAE